MKVGHLSVQQDGDPEKGKGEHRDWSKEQHGPCRDEGSMEGGFDGCVRRGTNPLWEGSKRRGDTPHPPSFGGVERGVWEGT